jgi:hypothetical protein
VKAIHARVLRDRNAYRASHEAVLISSGKTRCAQVVCPKIRNDSHVSTCEEGQMA